MSSIFQLQLVPAHNPKAGRNLPLELGRVHLTKWWWHSCDCLEYSKQPCPRCQLVATKTKSLSKKMLYITKSGSLSVVTKKNRHLLWYNGESMCKSSDSTRILLQPGDSISIGNSDASPWLDFYIKRIPIPITPEETSMKNAQVFPISARPPTSRKRLYYTHATHCGISADSSGEQLVFDSQTDSLNHTQSSPPMPSSLEKGWKRKKTSMMSPKRLWQGRDIRIPVKGTSVSNNDNVSRKRHLQQTDFSSWSSEEDGVESKAGMTTTTRREETNARTIKGGNDDSSSALSLISTRDVHKNTFANQQQLTQESNETSSILSLPQCPTWNDEDEDANTGTQEQEKSSFSGESNKEEKARGRGFCLNAFGSTTRKQSDAQQSQDDDDESPAIQFASSLSLAQWKRLRNQQDDANPTVGRVRRALAILIVAQRARGGDESAAWLPTLLEGTVLEDDMEST